MPRLDDMARRLVAMGGPSKAALAQIDNAFVDLLGCAIGGNRHDSLRAVHVAAANMGEGKAPAYGTELSFAPPQAALVNATAAHTEELDDWEGAGNTHPSAVIWPALWALASARRMSGATLARAYATGFETIARLGEAVNFEHYNRGWHSTATIGITGAAAACASALELDADAMCGAIGLALTQASGYAEQFGSVVKPMQAGFAARDGLCAALFAEQGLKGRPGILDGPRGFVALMAGGEPGRLDAAIARIDGAALDDWGLVMKLHPSCGYTHRLVDCAIAIHDERGAGAVGGAMAIRCEIPDFHYAVMHDNWPHDEASARFGLPFVVATALVHGRIGREHIRAPDKADDRVRALFGRIEIVVTKPARPELNYDEEQPDRLVVAFGSGNEMVRECAWPVGAPQRPLGQKQILAKFAENAAPLPVRERLWAWSDAMDVAAHLREVTAP